jgi:hypothetical protein
MELASLIYVVRVNIVPFSKILANNPRKNGGLILSKRQFYEECIQKCSYNYSVDFTRHIIP